MSSPIVKIYVARARDVLLLSLCKHSRLFNSFADRICIEFSKDALALRITPRLGAPLNLLGSRFLLRIAKEVAQFRSNRLALIIAGR